MHTIRLRKPWLRIRSDERQSQRVDVPDDDATAALPLRMTTYTRNFNRPSGIDEDTEIFLRIESWRGELVAILINQQELATAAAPLEIKITNRLANHNQLCIQLVDTDDALASLDGEVTLAIGSAS